MEKFGAAHNDETSLLLGRIYQGVSRFHLGEFVQARVLFEQGHPLSEPAHRSASAAWVAEDPYVMTLAWLGWTFTYLGYLSHGRKWIGDALSAARRLDHAYTLGFVLTLACAVSYALRSPHEVQRRATEALALSNEHGFPFSLAWGRMLSGWSLAMRGEAREGLAQLIEGLSVYRAVGAVSMRPLAFTMFAETYAQLLQPAEGLNSLAEAIQVIDASQERCQEAEVYRLRGELLMASGKGATLEQNLNRALATARQQSAKLLELRAACDLARLWRDQGKRTEAHNLLALVYAWRNPRPP
jgi:hypothetical protein